ncbi:1-deoxy-D-xylulose-5-phosphate synthase [Lignipirellula cremea]|uniref:1-deoxy-D-xylulose-5-phosphate synthase n=1 Tax=Lignipirellula cremea TaxID=2528010 RepID=A0A518DMV3_9BACT|nr:1-deoxy-D-xylulose-5-phosphate synthase [Lignipirellula cremea]QDU93170.1 1-deoxy-D-xylulose-5-phosphate synthase [Lignipirellula cremea]
MHQLLSKIESAIQLHEMSNAELEQLGGEIREVLCNLLSTRTAHFASNLGVVELCLAMHSVFDFRTDRLIWDTGHQIYPHKLVTGRYHEFSTIRTRGGLMGYPNPKESEYDLFMTGHAGCSVSTVLGLRSGDDLLQQSERRSVAVIGDGAFPSGIVYEAMNNAGGMKADVTVILNDNKMSICPRVGGLATYLDRLRTTPFYTGLKNEVVRVLNMVPVLGDPTERFLAQLKEGVKAGLHGGMLFEDLGFRYIGPIDGHNIAVLRKYLQMVKNLKGPVLLHVVTEKGHGFSPAASDPVYFHTPPAFQVENGQPAPKASGGSKAFTHYASDSIACQMRRNPKVTVHTAAMCQGNKLEPVRDEFPDRFFDVGICESHAVAFAAGQCKAGLRPIVDIYSTFLQRSYDQIFQEVALQNLPVVFMMDRAGLTGPDGPTHHGLFDIAYMRVFPNMVVMAPADGPELSAMLEYAVDHDSPCSLRYPKTSTSDLQRERPPIELGKAETVRQGDDGVIVSCGALLSSCLEAAEQLAEEGLQISVVNARFIKPIDTEMVRRTVTESPFVVTVEEGCLQGGFGSAFLEAASDAALDTRHVRRLGIPDLFVEHGEREDLLADYHLTPTGLVAVCREMAQGVEVSGAAH